MKRVEIEMLSETTNSAVVSVPGRKFPGVIVQGDSLKNLLNLAGEIEELSKSQDRVELMETIGSLKNQLNNYVQEYEVAMKMHHRPLPYVQARAESASNSTARPEQAKE